jgi:adenylate cyclase
MITVTEVGDIKRELAYHGEVLHTASRLEKLCNKLEKNILMTEDLHSNLPARNGYNIVPVGEFQLRGKEGKEKVYGAKRA